MITQDIQVEETAWPAVKSLFTKLATFKETKLTIEVKENEISIKKDEFQLSFTKGAAKVWAF